MIVKILLLAIAIAMMVFIYKVTKDNDDEGGGEPLLLTAPHGAYDGFPYPLHRLIHRLLISCAMAVLPGNEEFIRIFPRWESPAFERPEADLAEIIRDYRRGKCQDHRI